MYIENIIYLIYRGRALWLGIQEPLVITPWLTMSSQLATTGLVDDDLEKQFT